MTEETDESSLQLHYQQLLKRYPVLSLLENPVTVFDYLCFQQIAVAKNNKEELRKTITSSWFHKQQVSAVFGILQRTEYKELKRVEAAIFGAAVGSGNELECDVVFSFGGIAHELETKVGKDGIQYLPPIPADYLTKLDEIRKESRSTDRDDGPEVQYYRERFFFLSIYGSQEELEEFLSRPEAKNGAVWIYNTDNYSVLHQAACMSSQNLEWSVEFMKRIVQFVAENSTSLPWNAQEFVNLPEGESGCTALHWAVQYGTISDVDCLIELGADVFIRDSQGTRALDLMYSHMPDAVLHLLSQTGATTYGNPTGNSFTVRFDFRAIMDPSTDKDEPIKRKIKKKMKQKSNVDLAPNGSTEKEEYITLDTNEKTSDDVSNCDSCRKEPPEMNSLARVIHCCSRTVKTKILSHIIVKTFVDLKMEKLWWQIYLLSIFYISVYLSYTAAAVYIYVVRFPQSDDSTNDTVDNSSANAFETICGDTDGNDLDCLEFHPAALIVTSLISLLYLGLEAWECLLLFRISIDRPLKTLWLYCYDLENILQFLFTLTAAMSLVMVAISGQPQSHQWLYTVATFATVVAWILILFQLGNFGRLGKYVYMFQTVMRRFLTVMALYLCLLIGFTLAFSIILPESRFVSYPGSFFRSFAMMTGELNFDDVFTFDENGRVQIAALFAYLGFTVVVTIVIVNLLVGLTVGDVKMIFKEADVIHREIQIGRLYIMESMLIGWSKRISVVSPDRRDRGAICDRSIGSIPKEFREELRSLLADPKAYDITSAREDDGNEQ